MNFCRQLLNDKDVLFVGYRMPHPLLHEIHMKIQTTPNTTPAAALDAAISDVISECSLLEEKFKVRPCFFSFFSCVVLYLTFLQQEVQRKKAPTEAYY